MSEMQMDPPPFHGLLADPSWPIPIKTVHCDKEARPGYTSLPAHEYEELPEVFEAKIDLLVSLLQGSKQCIAYTGAGISTSSGIADYASVSAGSNSKVADMVSANTKSVNWLAMKPSLAHCCLTELYFSGILKWWCQQNHDGLPQKAGMPQRAMNEIHGSWWDPSNPVVKMNGQLRGDLFEELLEWEDQCDLCVAVGTSLAGMNADRLVESCGTRATKLLKKRSSSRPPYIGGSVIIGFQRTRLDHLASLRIFASIDRVMVAVAERMGLDIRGRLEAMTTGRVVPEEDEFQLRHYDAVTGARLADADVAADAGEGFTLSLAIGAKLSLVQGPYAGSLGEVVGRTSQGNYKILFQVQIPQPVSKGAATGDCAGAGGSHEASGGTKPKRMQTAPQNLMLGRWMAEAAVRGDLKQLPVVNV